MLYVSGRAEATEGEISEDEKRSAMVVCGLGRVVMGRTVVLLINGGGTWGVGAGSSANNELLVMCVNG